MKANCIIVNDHCGVICNGREDICALRLNDASVSWLVCGRMPDARVYHLETKH